MILLLQCILSLLIMAMKEKYITVLMKALHGLYLSSKIQIIIVISVKCATQYADINLESGKEGNI